MSEEGTMGEVKFKPINDVPGSTAADWEVGGQLERAMGHDPEMSGTRREFVRQARQLRKDGLTLAPLAVLRPHLGQGVTADQREAITRAIGEAQRDVAEALRMATRAGIGFEQGMVNARRLAADADRKATEAFRQLRAIAGRGLNVEERDVLTWALRTLEFTLDDDPAMRGNWQEGESETAIMFRRFRAIAGRGE